MFCIDQSTANAVLSRSEWSAQAMPLAASAVCLHFRAYDYIIVAFSGGKDSTACVLHLLERGVDPAKLELWHHLVDGREGSSLMDWPITEDYCRQFAKSLGLQIYFSWKEGGFEREMLRNGQKTSPSHFEYLGDNIIECGLAGGKRGKNGTRRKFPQVSANLSVRWCSAYLKIDVCTLAINNQERFLGKKTLVVTGERAEESAARAKYRSFEPDRADNRNGKRVRRHIDRWRPIHSWSEAQVWEIIKWHRIQPHPAYCLGWGRLSCMSCIFGSDTQWVSVNAIASHHVKRISSYEKEFGLTIHRSRSVTERIRGVLPYPSIANFPLVDIALSKEYHAPIITNCWKLPSGAFGEANGPT